MISPGRYNIFSHYGVEQIIMIIIMRPLSDAIPLVSEFGIIYSTLREAIEPREKLRKLLSWRRRIRLRLRRQCELSRKCYFRLQDFQRYLCPAIIFRDKIYLFELFNLSRGVTATLQTRLS
jgi:hypothetical protein